MSCSSVLVCQLLLEWFGFCACSTSTGICVGGELVCVCVQLVLEYVWGRVSVGILHGCGEEAWLILDRRPAQYDRTLPRYSCPSNKITFKSKTSSLANRKYRENEQQQVKNGADKEEAERLSTVPVWSSRGLPSGPLLSTEWSSSSPKGSPKGH